MWYTITTPFPTLTFEKCKYTSFRAPRIDSLQSSLRLTSWEHLGLSFREKYQINLASNTALTWYLLYFKGKHFFSPCRPWTILPVWLATRSGLLAVSREEIVFFLHIINRFWWNLFGHDGWILASLFFLRTLSTRSIDTQKKNSANYLPSRHHACSTNNMNSHKSSIMSSYLLVLKQSYKETYSTNKKQWNLPWATTRNVNPRRSLTT